MEPESSKKVEMVKNGQNSEIKRNRVSQIRTERATPRLTRNDYAIRELNQQKKETIRKKAKETRSFSPLKDVEKKPRGFDFRHR